MRPRYFPLVTYYIVINALAVDGFM